jgi:hypothetical protein
MPWGAGRSRAGRACCQWQDSISQEGLRVQNAAATKIVSAVEANLGDVNARLGARCTWNSHPQILITELIELVGVVGQ